MASRCFRITPSTLCFILAVSAGLSIADGAWTRETSMSVTCDSREYQACIAMADPLIRDPRLVFPDNMNDIDRVCRIWAQFVDCVKRYTDRCFSPARRQQFNQAVQRSVDSVHQMCTQTPYQAEYLSHAACIKSTLTEEAHCGSQYRHLADIVAGQEPVTSRVHICCSHHGFRECVLRETRRQCDAGLTGPATRFATHILDKALSFLHEDCTNYIPSNGDCPKDIATIPPPRGSQELSPQRETPMRYNTPPRNRESNRFPMGRSSRLPMDESGMTPYGPGSSPVPPEVSPAAPVTPAPVPWNPTPSPDPWTPGRVESSPNPLDKNPPGGFIFNNNNNNNKHGMSTEAPWNKEPTQVPWGDTSTKISGLGDGQIYVHSTESWYPEAGMHNGIIDEPNQQGLNQKNHATSSLITSTIFMVIPLLLVQLL